MSEMVERVARAIYRESVGSAQWEAWETFTPDAWGRVKSMAQARAAIKAMREPTEAMCQAPKKGGAIVITREGHQPLYPGNALQAWRIMIDAAFAPPEPPGGAA